MNRPNKEEYLQLIEDAANTLSACPKDSAGYAQYNKLHMMLQRMREGTVKLEVKRDYWAFWRGSSECDFVSGYDEADAMTRAGFGAGAMGALDFICPVPYGRDAIYKVTTLPDKDADAEVVFHHVAAQTWIYFGDLKKGTDNAELWECLWDQLDYNLEKLHQLYPEREFTVKYVELVAQLQKADRLPDRDVVVVEIAAPVIVTVSTSQGTSVMPPNVISEATKSDTPILDGLKEVVKTVGLGFHPL